MPAVTHHTFTIERTFAFPPSAVFAVFASEEKKRRWYAKDGTHEVLSYTLDFRPGGHEVLVARMKPGTPIAGAQLTWSHLYADIVRDERLTSLQTLDVGDSRISCALITVELSHTAEGCTLAFTHQAAYAAGADGPALREMGWRALLDAIPAALS